MTHALRITTLRLLILLTVSSAIVLVTTLPFFHLARKQQICISKLDCGFDPATDSATVEKYGLPFTVFAKQTQQVYEPSGPSGELAIVKKTSRSDVNYVALLANWIAVAIIGICFLTIWRMSTKKRA